MDFSGLHFTGLLLGMATFLIIGIFHPVVVKFYYWFGTRCWWWFLVLGVAAVVASLFVEAIIWQTLLGVLAFSSFWTIKEIFEQREWPRDGFPPIQSAGASIKRVPVSRQSGQIVISPQSGCFMLRATWPAEIPVPKRNISFVRAASVVRSWPEITPARSRILPV